MGTTVLTPTSKVTTAAVTGAVVTILTWVVSLIWHVDLSVVLGALVNGAVMVVAAYLKREKVKL